MTTPSRLPPAPPLPPQHPRPRFCLLSLLGGQMANGKRGRRRKRGRKGGRRKRMANRRRKWCWREGKEVRRGHSRSSDGISTYFRRVAWAVIPVCGSLAPSGIINNAAGMPHVEVSHTRKRAGRALDIFLTSLKNDSQCNLLHNVPAARRCRRESSRYRIL